MRRLDILQKKQKKKHYIVFVDIHFIGKKLSLFSAAL